MLLQVAYTSRAADGIASREVYDIIRVAQNRNAARALTGCLVFADGWFAQVLEGERHVVDELLQRISADPRHLHLDVRWRQPIAERMFPGDWMALRLGAAVDSGVPAGHGHEGRFAAASLDGPALVAFVRRCCDHRPL